MEHWSRTEEKTPEVAPPGRSDDAPSSSLLFCCELTEASLSRCCCWIRRKSSRCFGAKCTGMLYLSSGIPDWSVCPAGTMVPSVTYKQRMSDNASVSLDSVPYKKHLYAYDITHHTKQISIKATSLKLENLNWQKNNNCLILLLETLTQIRLH